MNNSNNQEKVIVILGETGVGKSSLGNAILMKKIFREYSSLDSETKRVKTSHGYLLNETTRQSLIMIDTPGFSDSNGTDRKHINNIIDEIKNHKSVNAFLLVFNSTTIRWNEGTNDMLDVLNKMFPEFWKNCIIILNHWSSNPEAERIREFQRPLDDDISLPIEEEIDKKIRQDFQYKNIPIIKLNSIYCNYSPGSSQFKKFCEDIENLNFTWNNIEKNYDTEKIQYVKKKNDEIIEKLTEDLDSMKKSNKEQYIKISSLEQNFLKDKRERHSVIKLRPKELFEKFSITILKKICKGKIKVFAKKKEELLNELVNQFNSANSKTFFNDLDLDDLKYIANKLKIDITGHSKVYINKIISHIDF
jgi:flagellar biosynthesis GTPase FlhF